MHNLILLITMLTTFHALASSKVEEIELQNMAEFGVVMLHKGSSDFRGNEFNLLFSVPKLDSNKCTIAVIETSFRYNGGFIAYNFLADSMEVPDKYSSHILAAKTDHLSIGIGARYNCKNKDAPSIYYSFGNLADIEKYFVNNGLVSKI